jgi:hypothetical protein
MSVEYAIEIGKFLAERSKKLPDDDIVAALEEVADAHKSGKEKQAELRERMGLSADGRDEAELTDEEIRKFLRGERRTDPRLK